MTANMSECSHLCNVPCFEESRSDELATEVTVRTLKVRLGVGLLVRSRLQLSDIKRIQVGSSTQRMESSKNICAVAARVCEDDIATGVFVPARDIIYFVAVDQPGVLGGLVSSNLRVEKRTRMRHDGQGHASIDRRHVHLDRSRYMREALHNNVVWSEQLCYLIPCDLALLECLGSSCCVGQRLWRFHTFSSASHASRV